VTEPVRFIGSKGLKAELLASAKADRAPEGSRRRALVAAAAAVAASTKAATATATLGTLARVAAWKWFAMGAVGLGTVVAAKAVIAPRATTVEVSTAPSAGPKAPHAKRRVASPIRPRAFDAIPADPALPLPVSPPPEPAANESAIAPVPPAAKPEPPAIKPPTPAVAARATAEPAPARAAGPSTSGSRLAAEITAIDQMKSALAGGNAADALRRVDAYRAAFPTGTLAAEATALRVEALARAGRRDEARAELARLRAGHPESPLLENLGQIVGE